MTFRASFNSLVSLCPGGAGRPGDAGGNAGGSAFVDFDIENASCGLVGANGRVGANCLADCDMAPNMGGLEGGKLVVDLDRFLVMLGRLRDVCLRMGDMKGP